MNEDKKVAEKFGSFISFSYFCPRLPLVALWRASKVFGVSVVSIYGKAFIRFVSDYGKSGKFQSQSELSNGRCSCSVYT